MAASWEVKDHLCCSLCLDTLNNSVTLPCGHSFCMACLLWPGGLWSCLQLSPVQTDLHTQTCFEEEYSAGWFAWENFCCRAVHPPRWGWSQSTGCRIWFFLCDEAEGCQIVLSVPGLLLYHSPAAPLWDCSFQTVHTGRSLCIPAVENLQQTWQAVGSVL